MYTLRFPFTLPPGREITVMDSAGELNGLKYRFAKQDRFYVLTVSGFSSAETAQAYLKDIRAGLMWVLLQTDITAEAVFEPQQVTYADDPMQAAANLSRSFNPKIEGPVDALLDGQRPAVYPTKKQVRVMTAGRPDVILGTTAEIVLKHLAEGLRIENSARVTDNQKLLTAFDLYAAYFHRSIAEREASHLSHGARNPCDRCRANPARSRPSEEMENRGRGHTEDGSVGVR